MRCCAVHTYCFENAWMLGCHIMEHLDISVRECLDQAQISAGMRSADLLHALSCIFRQCAHLSIYNQRGKHKVLVGCHLNSTDCFLCGHWDDDGQKVQCTVIIQVANIDESSIIVVFQEALDIDVVFLSHPGVNRGAYCGWCHGLLTVVSKISMSRFNKSRGNLYCLAEIQAYHKSISIVQCISVWWCLTRMKGAWRDVNVGWFNENRSMAVLNDCKGKRGYNRVMVRLW